MKDIGNHWEKAYAEKLRQERPASVLYETTAIYIFLIGLVLYSMRLALPRSSLF